MSKVVQENFGDAIIMAVRNFAEADLDDVQTLAAQTFDHVGDAQFRQTLAETFYGARWIYKLGLALLVRDEEQLAHVRQQIFDYGTVCEGMLSDMLHHAIDTGRMHGQKHRYKDTVHHRYPINWNVQDKLRQLTKQSFHWHIDVAQDEQVISLPLASSLHRMRQARNTIHARARTYKAYLGTSHALFQTVLDTVSETKRWRAANP